jgi:transposase InsO family protein
MRIHANARLTPHQRGELALAVLSGEMTKAEAAASFRCSAKTVVVWTARFEAGGQAAMADRSSAPHRVANKTPVAVEAAIEALRRARLTAAEIAMALSRPLSTVTAVCKRIGLNRLSRLAPPEPPNRYERRRAGELLHIDVKKLGRIGQPGHRVHGDRRRRARGIGWECVHVAVDDATRLAYVEVLPDERIPAVVGFLRRAVAAFAERGVTVERVMTDNGPAYLSHAHAEACRQLGLRHLRTRPYRPRTNGKAERFIQTMLRKWAYGPTYDDSAQRIEALAPWLERYNSVRPHGSLGKRPPAARLAELLEEPA